MADNRNFSWKTHLYRAAQLRAAKETGNIDDISSMDIDQLKALAQEALIYQIELEMQNEELREAHIALEESQRKYFDLYDLAPSGYMTVGSNGMIIEANLTSTSLLGFTKSELVQKRFTSLICERDRVFLDSLFKRALSDEGVHGITLTMEKKDGETLDAHLDCLAISRKGAGSDGSTPEIDQTDSPDSSIFQLTIVDISPLIKARQELKDSRNTLNTALDGLDMGIALIDRNFRIILFNKKMKEWFSDIKQESSTSLNHLIKFPENKRPHLFDLETLTLKDGVVRETKAHILVNDEPVEMRIVLNPVLGPDRNVQSIVAVFEDITDQTLLRKEIQNREKLESIGTLAGGIAHDFNNLLQTIIGNLSLARLELDEPETLRETLKEMDNAAQLAKGLTRQLLTFSTGGKPVKSPVSLENHIEKWVRFALSGSQIRPEFFFSKEPFPVNIDVSQINQVINNITINGQQSMKDGGTFTVRIENVSISQDDMIPLDEGDYLKISLEDQGPGIGADDLDKIFEPFFSTKNLGSGLGLASAYSIVRNHGGHIEVKSEEGQGCIFTFYLPRCFLEPETASPNLGAPEKGEGTVLILDDEESICDLYRRTLIRLGYTPVITTSGLETIERFKKLRSNNVVIVAAILDLTLPGGMGGVETAAELFKIDPDLIAIIASGYSNSDEIANFRSYGFKGVLPKPFTIDELGAVLNRQTSSIQTGSKATPIE